jgi:two-component system copper resistance phosphate regulon response regulator CusR
MRILAIEDEPRMSALLHKGLSEHGHEVTVALTGADGLKVTLDHTFEVILLDVGLPDLNGYDVAQVLKERRCPSPILMLTAYNKEDQIVRGLDLGADDYLTKPFSFPELLARLRALTRSAQEPAPMSALNIADLTVDLIQHKVFRKGHPIDLTRTEFLLLELLTRSSPQVASRTSLIQGIWGSVDEVSNGALDVLVNSLRSKIDLQFTTKLLRTVRGSGYQLQGNGSE